jgi:prepilin-type N-terminal cleavage/methylation domain-containing protein
MISSVDSRAGTSRDKGFTLVELLIVIVILGVLATVTVFAVNGITSKAKASSCQADTSSLNTAIEAYNAGEGSYPATLPALATATAGGQTYLKTLPANYATRFTYTAATGTLTPTTTC